MAPKKKKKAKEKARSFEQFINPDFDVDPALLSKSRERQAAIDRERSIAERAQALRTEQQFFEQPELGEFAARSGRSGGQHEPDPRFQSPLAAPLPNPDAVESNQSFGGDPGPNQLTRFGNEELRKLSERQLFDFKMANQEQTVGPKPLREHVGRALVHKALKMRADARAMDSVARQLRDPMLRLKARKLMKKAEMLKDSAQAGVDVGEVSFE